MNSERNVVKTFMEIVQVDSPSNKEQEMAQDVVRRLKEIGLNPQIDKVGNVIAYLEGDPNKEPIFLNGHLDTVQGSSHIEPTIDTEGWIRPSKHTILGADNKTAVAAILETASRLVSEKSLNHHPLELVFTVSEETENLGAIGLDYTSLKAKRGFSFDGGSEKIGDIVISSPFYERFEFELLGKSGHAGHPELANNILPATAKAVLMSPLGQVDSKTVANIGYVQIGTVNGEGRPIVNTIPGRVLISGEVRSTNEDTLVKTRNTILSAFSKNASESGLSMVNIPGKSSFYNRENPGFEFSPEDPFVSQTYETLQKIGVDPHLVKSMGCFDANIFYINGIQVLNISDGSLEPHSEGNERVRVSELERLQDMVYKLATS